MTLSEILEIAENSDCQCFGFRQHHTIATVGEELPYSYNTVDDEEPVELDGTCAIEFLIEEGEEEIEWCLEQLEEGNYQDGSLILIGGESCEYGNDDNEVVIKDAEVLCVIKKIVRK